ncbi:MAG: hypothetical protein JW957_00240 [Candidatus Omnitrophica bacterium]|nr:hypothetical protein [Candidatus Omnitrophota bacterium]
MKKTGLGRDPLKWINSTSESAERSSVEKEVELHLSAKKKKEHGKLPKYKTFDIRLTSLLREDQLEFLEKLIRDIQKNRAPEFREERITKNTLMRVFIDAFMDVKIDTADIPDEEALLKKVRQAIK